MSEIMPPSPPCLDCQGKRPAVVHSYMRPLCLVCALNLISERAGVTASFLGLDEKPKAVR